MNRYFSTLLLNDNGKPQTRTVSGVPGISVEAEKQDYSFEEINEVVSKSHKLERMQYGWEVEFTEDGQLKRLFIRLYGGNKSNATTSEKQTIQEWIEHLYGLDVKQVELF